MLSDDIWDGYGPLSMNKILLRATCVFVLLLPSLAYSQGTITTVIGTGAAGFSGDALPATSAAVRFPNRVALDALGNIYIADQGNHRIRKFTLLGFMTTVAGNGVADSTGDGASATSASLNSPSAVALDAAGNLYIADTGNQRVRKVSTDGTIRTVAGSGLAGFSGDGSPATLASLNGPRGVAVDAAGNLYIADTGNHRIRRVTSDGVIRTVAGNGTALFLGDGGPATAATLNAPWDIALDASGNLYIADTLNNVIRKVGTTGTITTVAGKGTASFSGDGGPAISATLNSPSGLALDSAGNLYIADTNNERIRKVAVSGIITTVTGTGDEDFFGDRAPAFAAALNTPRGVTVDASGVVYIADTGNHRIRLVTREGFINTVGGTGTPGFSGEPVPVTDATLNAPAGVAVDAAGFLYIADSSNNRIRKTISDGSIIVTAAGQGTGSGLSSSVGDGGPSVNALLSSPFGVTVDTTGSVYIADSVNNRVRKVDLAGIIKSVAGNGFFGFDRDDVLAISTSVSNPLSVAVDRSGNLYIADTGSHRIRKVDKDGVITTVAGNGFSSFSGDGGPATSASLRVPSGVALDGAGNLYVADTDNHRVRVVTPGGIINTLAGNGTPGLSGDGGLATSASLNGPTGVAVDAFGNVFIADTQNHVVRKVGRDGKISTVAGNGQAGFTGDGGLGTSASLNSPTGVAVDARGVLFIADRFNHRIRKVQPPGQLAAQPSSLTFSVTAGTTGVLQQTITITNVALAPLNWTAEAATQSGGFWLFASTASGTTPGTVNAIVRPSGLAAGTYQGTITIRSDAAVNSPLVVNVTLTVTAAPAIALSSSSLSFGTQQGAPNPPNQTVTISNSGGGTLSWTATASTQSGGSWLNVSPASGTGTGTLAVSANIAGLVAGTYQGAIQVAASGASNTPQTINVTLVVAPLPVSTIALSPTALQFTANVGANPPTQTFQVQNSGAGTLGWTAATATQSGGNWLAVSPSSGTAPSTLTVTVNSAALTAGSYTGSIVIAAATGANASNSPQTLAVTLLVGAPTVGDNGVVNGASFSKDAVVSPGSIASLFGTNLAKRSEAATSLPLPTTLAGSQVLVNNNPVPLFFVSAQQINFQMPADVTASTVSIAVSSDGLRGLSVQVKIAGEVPGIFTATPGGTGQGAVLNQDFTPNSDQSPAAAGSVVQIFATGLGATNPALVTGQPGASQEPFQRTVATPVVLIGGVSAEVLFSAAAPGFVGLYQVNARVPAGTAAGSAVSLQIQVSGRSSNTVTIAVKSP